MRTAVAVVGAGVNIQAAAIEGLADQDDWQQLIEKIAVHIEIGPKMLARLPVSHLAKWELLLRLWADRHELEPFEAEQKLQTFVCQELREQETRYSAFELYSEFAEARFRDIISLNFDRRIALSSGREKFVVGPKRCPEGSHGEALYRHSLIPHDAGAVTRIWYPHGDTRKASTLKLGVRKYGFYVVTLRESLGETDDQWRYKRSWLQSDDYGIKEVSEAGTWVHRFLSRPLVFIGCGLSRDEWPLWSLLRERDLVCPDQVVMYLTAGRETEEERNLLRLNPLLQVKVVRFPSFAELWTTVRETLASQ